MIPRTITTYLIHGNPNGLKTIFMSNKTCKALVIPRTEFLKLKDRPETYRPAVYFLINQDENQIYVGESETFYERLKNHAISKEFWNIAIAFFSQNNDLTKADVKYLEHLALEEIGAIGNIKLEENKQKSVKPNLPEHQEATINEFFIDVKFITEFLGYDYFTKVEISNKTEIFYCKRSGTNAKGIYEDGKFTILKGSIILKDTKDGNRTSNKFKDMRNDLIKNHAKIIDGKFAELTQDITFNSPSTASSFVIGYSSNGWIDWKNADNKTMDEIIRENA
jgi:hypothetical protein